MNRQGALRRCAHRFQPRLLPIAEPLLVGQVFTGLPAGLVNHLQLVSAQLAHCRSLLTPVVGNLIVHGLVSLPSFSSADLQNTDQVAFVT